MSDSITTIRTVFNSPLLHIVDVGCPGHDTPRGAEEVVPTHEIILTRRGAFERRDSRGTVLGDPLHAVLAHSQQGYEVRHPAGGEDRCMVLIVDPPALLDVLTTHDPHAADRPERPFTAGSAPMAPRLALGFHRLIAPLAQGAASDPLAVEEAMLTLLGELFAALQREIGVKRRARPVTAQARTEIAHRVRVVLNAHLDEPISIDDLARLTHTSPYHLCRVFRTETGLPIHRYLLRLRLLAALDALGEDHTPLADLALVHGFASHSHFSTAFQREFGMPPSIARNHPGRGQHGHAA